RSSAHEFGRYRSVPSRAWNVPLATPRWMVAMPLPVLPTHPRYCRWTPGVLPGGARAARDAGPDSLVDDGPGGGRFLSGSDRDLRWLRPRTRGRPRPGIGKFQDRTLCRSPVSTGWADRSRPGARYPLVNGTTAALER